MFTQELRNGETFGETNDGKSHKQMGKQINYEPKIKRK
jgi:hypothetical protein